MIGLAAVLTFALGATEAQAGQFLDDLRSALARQDRRAVASLCEYPVMVLSSGLRMPMVDRAALLRMYDPIFSSELQTVIAMARIAREGGPPPTYPVVLSGDSLTIGPGWVWARRASGRFRIARLMLPSSWVSAQGAPPPRRIFPSGGERPVLLSGTLNPHEMQSYIIGTAKGQRLDLRLEGFPGRDVVMRVLDRRTGLPFDARAADGARVWFAMMPNGGDVRIDVLRLSPEEKPVPLYVLSVGLK